MLLRKSAENHLALAGHLYSDQSPICRIGLTVDEPGSGGTIDEFADAVVAQHQVIGHLGDGRSLIEMTLDGEEELVLGGGQPDIAGRPLAPTQEPTQLVAEVEQAPVVRLPVRCHGPIQAGFVPTHGDAPLAERATMDQIHRDTTL